MLDNRLNKVLVITTSFIVLLATFTLGITLYNEKKFTYDKNTLKKIGITGNYIINNENKSYPLPDDGKLNLSGRNSVVIEGHFTKDIPINTQLIMRIDNMMVKIFVNNEKFYSFGENDTFLSYAKSAGNLWTSFVSPGIKITDNIRIELYNVYTDHVDTTFSSFLNSIYTGYESSLILNNISEEFLNGFISIFVVCVGIISIVLACIMMKLKKPMGKLITFGGLCISSGIWCFLNFNIQNYLFPYPIFNNSLDIISLLFSMFFLISHFALYLNGKGKFILFGLSGTFLVAIAYTTVMQFLGIKDYYEHLFLIQSVCLIYTPIIVVCIFYDKVKLKNNDINKLLFTTIILAIGIMGDAICNMLELIPYMLWFKISYGIFIVLQFINITKIIRSSLLESARIQVLEELAYQDGLTKVKNRTAYLKKVEKIKKDLNKELSLDIFVFDINNLKIVNDTLGHESGDQLIKRGADILVKVFGKDSIYRIGGDEFVVIKENKSSENSIKFIKYLEQEIKNNNCDNLSQPHISLAFGVSVYDTNNHTSYEDAFSKADKEMYENKARMKR